MISMVSSVLLITDYVLDRGIALLLTSVIAAFFLVFWVGLPFARRDWGEPDTDFEERRDNPEPYEER
jgi:hypothetical protein